MRQIILLSAFIFTFMLNYTLQAQVIWEEHFDVPGKGYWAVTDGAIQSDLDGVDWTLDVSGCTFASDGDYAKTVSTSGGRFETIDSDGDVIWYSPQIDISGFTAVNISLVASETGSGSGEDKKFVKARYIIDNELFSFQPDSAAAGNWGEKTLTATGAKGNSLQLVVVMNSSYANDKVIIDDVVVEDAGSTPNEPAEIRLTSVPSYAFTGEEIVISAQVYDENGQTITDRRLGLSFQSTQLVVADSSFESGIYFWVLVPQQDGISGFSVHFEDTTVQPSDSIIKVYNRNNLVFSENFVSGDLSSWTTDGQWAISSDAPISGQNSLKHIVQPAGGISTCINNTLHNNLGDGNYFFTFKLKNGDWDPSSSNAFYVELGDTSADGSLSNGYAVGINASGSTDLASLWVVRDGVPGELVLETTFDWNENTVVQFDVTRDAKGNWNMAVADLNTGITGTGTGYNNDYLILNHVGLHFKFSQTRSGQLWFDDLVILRENTPPAISWIKVLNDGRIEVCFTEEINPNDSNPNNFKLQGESGQYYTVESVENAGGDTLILSTSEITETELTLTVLQVEDMEGAVSSNLVFRFEYQPPILPFDVVITEIMADPTPVVGLPDAEYIELLNQSSNTVNLENWKLSINNQTATLPKSTIDPGDYVIVCSQADSTALASYGKVIAPGKFPSLLNTGTLVVLAMHDYTLIDRLVYSDSWYGDTKKKSGGWSLEKIDPSRSCGNSYNWIASNDVSGGTPGRVNSVDAINIDTIPPAIESCELITAQCVSLTLSEPVDETISQLMENIRVDKGLVVDSIAYAGGILPVRIYFSKTPEANIVYTITVDQLTDLCGNAIQNLTSVFTRQVLSSGDIVINEVLYNPRSGGSDFVELYNRSGLDVDISKLSLATRNDTFALKSIYPLAESSMDFPDQSYLVFTKDSANLIGSYWVPYPERVAEMHSFPSFPDDQGHVVLLNDSLEIIDEFAYSADMQSPWLSDMNGVSLERLSVTSDTNDPDNWHSASSLAGYATPGYENSQPDIQHTDEASLLLSPDAISPNGDGYHDELEISFHLDKTGYLANVYVFNAKGQMVNRLVNNGLVGNNQKIVFGGVYENGTLLPMGIYIVLAELIHPDGDHKVFKRSFLITDKQ